MNEEEKDSIEILKNTDLDVNTIDLVDLHTYNHEVKTVLKLLEKKDKIIDLMGEKIFEEGIVWENKEDVKQYFERKVENGN